MEYVRSRLLLFVIGLSIASSTGCGLIALGVDGNERDAGRADGSESDSGIDGTCRECVLNDDCQGDLVCECVDNEETGEPFCFACVPAEYETLQGAKQDETYTCERVDETS